MTPLLLRLGRRARPLLVAWVLWACNGAVEVGSQCPNGACIGPRGAPELAFTHCRYERLSFTLSSSATLTVPRPSPAGPGLVDCEVRLHTPPPAELPACPPTGPGGPVETCLPQIPTLANKPLEALADGTAFGEGFYHLDADGDAVWLGTTPLLSAFDGVPRTVSCHRYLDPDGVPISADTFARLCDQAAGPAGRSTRSCDRPEGSAELALDIGTQACPGRVCAQESCGVQCVQTYCSELCDPARVRCAGGEPCVPVRVDRSDLGYCAQAPPSVMLPPETYSDPPPPPPEE